MGKRSYLMRVFTQLVAVLCCLYVLGGCHNIKNNASVPHYEAELIRTSYGVPHIKDDSDANVGFGLGYAMAEDQIANIMDFITTANGERSKYFGPNNTTAYFFRNLDSDIYEKWQNSDAAVEKYLAALSPEILAGLKGMAAGINQYLLDNADNLPAKATGAAWVRPITVLDLVKLNRRYSTLLSAGSADMAGAIVAAAPPGTVSRARQGADARQLAALEKKREQLKLIEKGASNAAAFGRSVTSNGSGLLFGNPHLYNFGETRLYLFHVTNPSSYDVFGSGFVGELYPEVGFNRHVAFTGTISTSQRMTYFALKLDPADPTAYIVDGVSEPMIEHKLSVEVLQKDGSIETQIHTIYETRYGPVFVKPGSYDWTTERAFAVRDVNLENFNSLERLRRVALSTSVEDIHEAQATTLGNPWLQTTAADDQGNVYYGNVSPVPAVTDQMLADCVDEEFQPLLEQMGTYPRKPASVAVLDGSRSKCNWLNNPESAREGVFPGNDLPWMIRDDFVQNSNDSSWMTNPSSPQKDYPRVVSRDNIPMGPRGQMGLTQIKELLAQGPVNAHKFLSSAFSNRVLMAERYLDQLLEVCGPSELDKACAILSAWDRKADLDSVGYLLFEAVWMEIKKLDMKMIFSPFDPADPVNTPATLLSKDPAVADLLRTTFIDVVDRMTVAGIPLDATLRPNQLALFGGVSIPIAGGIEGMGTYNRVNTMPLRMIVPTAGPAQRMVIGGPTHIQAVTFGVNGPINFSALVNSESADPASPHVNDLTAVYSAGQWVSFPFSQEEIEADPKMTVKTVRNKQTH